MTQIVGIMRRNLFRAVCTIVSLVLIVLIWVLRLDVHTWEVQNREHTQENQAMLSTLVSGPLVKQELARAQEIVQRIDGNLVVESKLEENFSYFYRLKRETGAEIIFLKQNPAESPSDGDYKVIPFTLQLAGTYEQLAAFVLSIETGPKLAQVKLFSFHRREGGSNNLALSIDVKLLARR
ncbi:MAG: hypothetical protein JWM35_784 [Verrucomicrobia bacterium]|nr:hypothetical protein [Verrucomicrobiota bacterium]